MRPNKSQAHQGRAAKSEQRDGIHWRRIRCGGPNASRPSVTPIESVNVASTTTINGLA